jgi:catechol-2,3-dioxygenase
MRFDEIILSTPSVAAVRRFYSQTLELPILHETADSIRFKVGHTALTFNQAPAGQKPFYHFAFNVTNNRFSDCFEWIDRKLDILQVDDGWLVKPYPAWNAQSFYFHDSVGNILECIVRFNLPYSSNSQFSSADLVEISEIGYVTNDLVAAEKEMVNAGLKRFPPGPFEPQFTPMGDEQGIVLVTGIGRGWIPTNERAERHPLTIRGAGGVQLQIPGGA